MQASSSPACAGTTCRSGAWGPLARSRGVCLRAVPGPRVPGVFPCALLGWRRAPRRSAPPVSECVRPRPSARRVVPAPGRARARPCGVCVSVSV